MEFLRRPNVLATIAAALLAINLVVLAADGSDGPGGVAIDDPLADGTASPADGDGTAGPTAGDDPAPTEPATGDPAPTDGATGDGTTDDPAAEAPADGDPAPVLTAPTEGSYTYASSGSWSYDGEQHQLPATATGNVAGGGDQWSLQLVAGQEYADTFTFTIGADGGLDWDLWQLERTINNQPSSTEYTCSADTAWYRPGADAGRTLTHACDTPEGSVSTGEVEVVGTEEVTLGDGTVVAADHIVYRTTDSSTNDQFEISGKGRLDMWLDPETGLRVKEQRSSRTTTTNADGQEFVYTEEVSFLLQSLTPGG